MKFLEILGKARSDERTTISEGGKSGKRLGGTWRYGRKGWRKRL